MRAPVFHPLQLTAAANHNVDCNFVALGIKAFVYRMGKCDVAYFFRGHLLQFTASILYVTQMLTPSGTRIRSMGNRREILNILCKYLPSFSRI